METKRIVTFSPCMTMRQIIRNNSVFGSHIDVVVEKGCAVDGYELMNIHRPNLIFVNLPAMGKEGFDFVSFVSRQSSSPPIVVSILNNRLNLLDAISAGADGYITNDCGYSIIQSVIEQALDGLSPVSPNLTHHFIKSMRTNRTNESIKYAQRGASELVSETDSLEDVGITKREHEVLRLAAKGFKYREIADTLTVSIHTIHTHMKHICRKLSVGSRGEAVFEASQIGLL